jgi:FixJ family two-component response regulator
MTRAERTIAVVDDDSSVRVALGRLLRLAGYTVQAYASGEELLAAVDRHTPDCAVLDVHLPGLSGFEIERLLRARSPRVTVVFITANDDVVLTKTALAAGGARLLRKPFSNDSLLEAVRAALENAA